MMTLEEVWENLRQDPETKATMEEVEKSYKLFKKIENLIVSDLEAELAESEKLGKRMYEQKEYAEKILRMSTHEEKKEICKLKQQLAEKEKEIEIEKEVSDWLYDIHNRTKFEEEVTQKYKTATEITKQCNLYEHCKNQFINDLRSEVKKKLKD